jgi:zinc transporter ZupT
MTHGTAADPFQSLGSALLFAAIFAGAGSVKLLPVLRRRTHALMSFFVGLSLSYDFVHLLPELETARASLKLPDRLPLPPEPVLVSLAMLAGCILFFILGRWTVKDETESNPAERAHPRHRIRLAIFVLYVVLVSYSRITIVEHGEAPNLLFATAMGAHFLALDHALGRDLGSFYQRRGRFVLAGGSILGWGIGAIEAVGLPIMLLLFGFVAGAIIAHSLIEELPEARETRLGPFLAGSAIGSLLYTLLLLPFG